MKSFFRVVKETLRRFFEFFYALFFTRDDDLDVLQLLFAVLVVSAIFIVWRITVPMEAPDAVRIEGLVTLRWIIGLLVLTAVPKWMIPFMVDNIKSLAKSTEKKKSRYDFGYRDSEMGMDEPVSVEDPDVNEDD